MLPMAGDAYGGCKGNLPHETQLSAAENNVTDVNSDILPPIFNDMVSHIRGAAETANVRKAVVDAFVTAVANVAAANVRERVRNALEEMSSRDSEIMTSDRLSGGGLTRADLVQQIQDAVQLAPAVLELALLLIESQIDLRLNQNRTGSLNLGGIHFTLGAHPTGDLASWFTALLPSVVRGVASDRSTPWSRLGIHQPEALRIFAEGLRMQATFREPVPYRISVDKFLLDPLAMRREEDEDARIRVAHISDLHLVHNIKEEGRKLLHPFGAATHGYHRAEALGLTIRGLHPRYHMLVATGDLTTNGARGAFETALAFLQRGTTSTTNQMRIAYYGLSAGVGNRLLVPGNHDRFGDKLLPGQHQSPLFEEVLGTTRRYPYPVGFRPSSRGKSSLTLLFFAFDSNLQECPGDTDAKGRLRAIATGRIEEAEIRCLEELAKKVARDQVVNDLYGKPLTFDRNNTIRIAVLHHHPFATLAAEQDAQQSTDWRHPVKAVARILRRTDASLMQLKNADSFVHGCLRAGIQVLLFGHQHVPYYRAAGIGNPDDIPLIDTPFGKRPGVIHGFCCASTTEHLARESGFYVFDFFDRKTFSVHVYSLGQSPRPTLPEFVRVPGECRTIDLDKSNVGKEDFKGLNQDVPSQAAAAL
jgi:3',5'-cyclic AMP phosphodiesterase CpdA